MILTSVQKKRNKAILMFSDSTEIIINYEVFLVSGIHKGDKVESKRIQQLISSDKYFQTKNSAYRFLSNRGHSTFEIRQKLLKKGYIKKDIDKVIDELTQNKLLDDHQFAERFIQHRIEKKKIGIIKIRSELYQKGIKPEIISEVVNKFLNDELQIDNAVSLLKTKYNLLRSRDIEYQKLKVKLYNHLRNKGFTNDIIVNALNLVIKND